MGFEQRNVTRNQSTADYSKSKIFIFDNRFHSGIFKNDTEDPLTLRAGMLVCRDVATPDGLIPATSANLAKVVGIATSTLPELAADATSTINYGVKGTVDSNLIILPATVTFNTTVGSVTLRDFLEGLGFHLEASVENTKFEE